MDVRISGMIRGINGMLDSRILGLQGISGIGDIEGQTKKLKNLLQCKPDRKRKGIRNKIDLGKNVELRLPV